MLADVSRPRQGIVAAMLGIGAVLFDAIGVIVQLKDTLNVDFEAKDPNSSGVWHFRTYVVSLAAASLLTADIQVAARCIRRLVRYVVGRDVAGLLCELGNSAIGFYIGKHGLESTYGTAASIVRVDPGLLFSA